MRHAVPALFAGIVVATLAVGAVAQSVSVPLALDHWMISEKNERISPEKSLENNGRIVEHRGRQSLKLAKGFAYVHDLQLQNGTIDADVAFSTEGDFIGLAFRVQSEDEYELFFFRAGTSGNEALQYTPGFKGANAWQLYNVPTYAGAGELPQGDQWFHVRIVFSGLEARLFLNNATKASLVIPDLKQGYSNGSIGFWGQSGGGYISNVSYTRDEKSYDPVVRKDFPAGTLTEWELSEAFDAGERDPAAYPDVQQLKWEKVQAESPGMVAVMRYRRDPNVIPPQDPPGAASGTASSALVPGSKFVFAKTTIHSEADEMRKLKIGYSDKVIVFLNGRPIFSGNNSFGAREHGFLGLINPENEAVYLPLKKGDNELMLAVTEFFGGWGFLCRLSPSVGESSH